jgi:quinol monooxygenase YgiN
MKALYAEFTASPGSEARLAAMVLELSAHVREEPGNVLFEPCTRVENPRQYVVFEVYRDDASFQAHLASSHSTRFNDDLHAVIEGDASKLRWLEPVG